MSARIFAVEDDALTSALLGQYVAEMGHQLVGTADNAQTALEQIPLARPDLVLMDVRLKGATDGIDLATRLHAGASVAVLYLTAFADSDVLARAKLTEPHGYLVKPFTKQSLQASIEIALYRSEMERKQQRIFDGVVRAITELVKLHDPFLNDTQARAAALADAIAVELDLPGGEARGIRLAAMLHGIGLVGMPTDLIYRIAPLDGAGQALFQTHPEVAWRLLNGIEFPDPVAEMVYQHMERLDGSGFPRGLSGADILPGARVVAVACIVAKMLTARGSRAPASVADAIDAIQQARGTQLDASVVDACVRVLREKRFGQAPA